MKADNKISRGFSRPLENLTGRDSELQFSTLMDDRLIDSPFFFSVPAAATVSLYASLTPCRNRFRSVELLPILSRLPTRAFNKRCIGKVPPAKLIFKNDRLGRSTMFSKTSRTSSDDKMPLRGEGKLRERQML